MPMIGPLLDQWEQCSNWLGEFAPDLADQLRAINDAMEEAGESRNGGMTEPGSSRRPT
jgi:hypothetical protein